MVAEIRACVISILVGVDEISTPKVGGVVLDDRRCKQLQFAYDCDRWIGAWVTDEQYKFVCRYFEFIASRCWGWTSSFNGEKQV